MSPSHFLTITSLLLTLAAAPLALAADFDKGRVAAQRGDYATALSEWKPLAVQGNTSAQFNLGVMYANGLGVLQDYRTARKWYIAAAVQEHASAQFNLGKMYESGPLGVPQDYKMAMRWYTAAANQGYVAAQINLGAMYSKGLGVPQDYSQAYMWFSLAASNGDEASATNREITAKKMTHTQIEEAQALAREWVAKH